MQRENKLKCFPILPLSHNVSKTTMSEKEIDIFGQLHILSFVDYLTIKFLNDFRYGLLRMQTTSGGGGNIVVNTLAQGMSGAPGSTSGSGWRLARYIWCAIWTRKRCTENNKLPASDHPSANTETSA